MTENRDIIQPPPQEVPKSVPGKSDILLPQATEPSVCNNEDAWLKRHRLGLGLAGVAIAGVLSVSQFDKTVSEIENDAHWAVPALALTETAAWGGAALMLLSAGSKIGNPLTVKRRLGEVAKQLEANSLYKKGFMVNVGGAAGTSTVIVTGAATSLPVSVWPLAAGAAGASLAFSALPLRNVGNGQSVRKQKISDDCV